MNSQRAYDPNEFLARAARAFWTHGYAGTSVADLVAATGVNRGSIYAAYQGKRALFLASLRHYDAQHRAGFLAALGGHPPRAAILAAFAAAAESPAATPPGCLLVNTATELGPHDPEIAAFVTQSLAQVEAFFADRLRAGQAGGTIPVTVPVAATATALIGLFLGLRVLTRVGADRAARDAIVARAGALLT
ncbi:TetR/AcrR family transcriptional repressor of nem operon [Rhodobacteraceae bacterium MBR-64]|jgi:TetR/AcrR family transcriptional repressor of nem operon